MEKAELEKLENKVSKLLELVVAKGIKELFEDARTILSSDNLNAPEKIIGHSLREIESALFSVTVDMAKLSPDFDIRKYECDESGKLMRTSQIILITDHFKLNLNATQLEFWKGIKFQKLAHRSGLKANKKITNTYISETWIPYTIIILEIAEGIHKVFLDYYRQLKQLAKNPLAKNCEAVLQKIPNNRHLREYFFKEIEDFSAWLPMLKSRKFFLDVPLEYACENGSLSTQPWPPLNFLTRIVSETQDCKILLRVAEIASYIPETENVRVNIDFLSLAGMLPAQLSDKYLMPRVMAALNSKDPYLMGETISGLLIKLNEGGFNERLLFLAKKVIFDERFNPYFENRYLGNDSDIYFYNDLLTVLCGFNDMGILRLLHNRVLEGLLLSYKTNQYEKLFTSHWKHAFDDEDKNDELVLMYVSKLFLSIKNLISSGNASLDDIVKMLNEGNKENWHIIDALILNIIETYDEQRTYDNHKIDLRNKLSDYEEDRRNREKSEVTSVFHISPYSDEELSALSAFEVIKRLERYDGPTDDWSNKPSRVGLRHGIHRQIKQRTNEFVACLESFIKLNNDDYANLICSFSQADFESDNYFEKNYLSLVNEFIQNRYDSSSEETRRNFSQSIFIVFRKIYSSSKCYINLKGSAFNALNKIISDRSISSAILSSTGVNRFRELSMHAFNTPSVQAFDCFFHCYITPSTKWADIRARDDFDTFKSCILSIIRANTTASFRFRLGMEICTLLSVDEEWFVRELKDIVLNKESIEIWEAFIAGMMAQPIICNNILDDAYRDAIRHVSTEEYLSKFHEQDDISIEKGIAKHISFFYCQLDEQSCKEDSLTNFIFVHGSLSLKRAFLSKADYQLKKVDCPDNVFNRIKELIDWRYEELGKTNFDSDKISELAGFFVLFPSLVNFDPEWSLKYLCEFSTFLDPNDHSSFQFSILASLIEQAEGFPLLTTKSLLSLVKHNQENIHYFSRLKILIETLHQHGKQDTHIILEEVLSRLSTKGICCELADLFPGTRISISG
ncbi:MAG: hypothetical protein Q8K02_18045 [Flavobacterium sp.]|nr:hypothetical protein [Flavobacterium sp.]